ncbi:DnaJ domain-containing protein, partial [Pavlovales sp. CCMP2436]
MHVVVLELPLWAGGDEVACQSLSGWPAGASDVLILPAPVVDDGADDADGEVGAHHADSASDAYAVLGLAGKRWTASQDDIRAAYRKLILKCHPDKRLEYAAECGEEPLGEDEATQRFRDLQAAFETLSDPKKRCVAERAFAQFARNLRRVLRDPLAPGLDFFETYAPVFERDSAWVNVASFYNFWFDFRSWRVFCQEDEHDVAEADFREE